MIYILKNAIIEGPGALADCLVKRGKELAIIELSEGEEITGNKTDIEALVILGGPMNVYETAKYPFLDYEDILLKWAISKQIPVIGICLGAQLLAKACGAKIVKAKNRELGWYDISLTDEGRLDLAFKGLTGQFEVFQWHGDTFEIPRNGILLAVSDTCTHQAFRVGNNAYGFQFHPEVTGKEISGWLREYKSEISPEEWVAKNDSILDHYKKNENKYHKQVDLIVSNIFGKL